MKQEVNKWKIGGMIYWGFRTKVEKISHLSSQFTPLSDHISQYACMIKTYFLVWLKDGGQARGGGGLTCSLTLTPHQMLISPRDRLLTTHSSCYWHAEWEESVLSYRNIKKPTKACGCRLYFHGKRLSTYLKKKLSLSFTEKTPTTPFYSSFLDGMF